MKLYSWNVNGLRAVAKKGFSDFLTTQHPDLLCLQEIKAQEDQLEKSITQIADYKLFIHSAERKGYSGTAVYYREEPLSIKTGLSDDQFNHEGRTIIMEYPEFTLFNIYFPNGQKDETRLSFKMAFYDCLLKDVNALVAQGKKVIVCGDVNTAHQAIDLKNPKSNAKRSGFLPMEREWLDHFFSEGYTDTWRYLHPDTIQYSWWSYRFNSRKNNAGWRIDYFFMSNNALPLLKNATIHSDILGSDHCPISIELQSF